MRRASKVFFYLCASIPLLSAEKRAKPLVQNRLVMLSRLLGNRFCDNFPLNIKVFSRARSKIILLLRIKGAFRINC